MTGSRQSSRIRLILLLLTASLLAACKQFSLYSMFQRADQIQQRNAGSTLVISPATAVVTDLSSVTFQASGGTSPYKFTLTNGAGTIGQTTGLYQAPSSLGAATVEVTDSAGATANATVDIVAANVPLAITPSSLTLPTGTSMSFSALGGTGPYTYSISAGGGTINSTTGVYQAPQTSGTATVTVTDSKSATSSAAVTISVVSSGLVLSPATASVEAGGSLTLQGAGGTSPYTYKVASGGGTIGSTSGVFQAPASAGTTTVQVTDSTGATANATLQIAAALEPLAVGPTAVTLTAGNTMTFSALGGSPPYSYAVTAGGGTVNPSTGVYQSPAAAGTATVTVTDSKSAASSASVTIAASGGLTISPPAAYITTGTNLTFQGSGGTAPYTFKVASGGGTINANTGVYTAPATAGTAKVQIIDATSATSNATVTIVPPPLALSPDLPTVTVGGVIDFAASGGSAPYTYAVKSGGAGGMIASSTGVYTAPTSPGTDTVTVTDASGATATATVTIAAASNVVISPATITIAAGGTQQFGASGGVSPYTYSLFSGAGSITKAGLYTAPNTGSTDTVRVTDSIGSTSDATVTVTPPSLTISPLTTSVIAGGNATFSASGGSGSYSFSVVSGGAGGTILQSGSSGVYTAPGVPGTDTVQVKDSSGATSDAVVTIVSASQLLISPTTVTVGAGNTYQFGATGGTSPYSYSLLSGAGSVSSSGLYTAPASASTDKVRVTDNVGATSDATVTVTAPVAAVAISPTAATINVAGSVSFTASGGTSPYTYSVVGGTSGGTINATTGAYTAPLSAGTYTVKVTDYTGATSSASVTVNAVPALAISPATLSMNAGATYQFGATGGVAPYAYTMYSGSGTVSSSGLYTAPDAAATDTVRVTDALGTTSDATVTVAAPVPPLAISPSAPSVTVTGQITFSVSGGTPSYSYSVLAGGAGGSINASGVYSAPSSTGTDTVQVTDSLNRTVDATVTVVAAPPLVISPATPTLSANATQQFAASGGVPPYSYSLLSGSGSVTSAGLYTAPNAASTDKVRVTDALGTTSDATVTVTALAISPASPSIVANTTYQFGASGGVAPYTYSVYSGTGTITSSGLYTAPSAVSSATVRVTDAIGETSDAAVTILPSLAISPATASVTAGTTMTFSASGGSGSYTFAVTSGGGTIGQTTGVYAAPATAGSATVQVTDGSGSTATASVTILASPSTVAISPTTQAVLVGGTATFSASGGTPPYGFSVYAGSGTINSTSGLYTAPASAGTATVRVTDASGAYSDSAVTIVAASQLVISPATLTIGVNETYQFSASGGSGSYTYSLLSGSGTVTSAGLYTAPSSATATPDVVQVTDGSSTSDAQVTVVAAGGTLTISPTTAQVPEGGTVTFAASGGTPSYAYSVTSGSGWVGANSGTYTATGAPGTTATVTVTDSSGNTASATITVIPDAPTDLTLTAAANHSTITLTWTNSSPTATQVYIVRNVMGSTTSTTTTQVTVTPGTTGTYLDNNAVSHSNVYEYYLYASENGQVSANSNMAVIQP